MDSIPGLHTSAFEEIDTGTADGWEGLEVMSLNGKRFLVPDSHLLGKCRLISDFEKISFIGEGAFGTVYKVRDKREDAIVALKKLKIGHDNISFPLNFVREISILKDLTHDNIVNLSGIAVGKAFESTYLILEYCPYELSNIIDDESAKTLIEQPQVKRILHQLLLGLEYIHHKYIIHRDLTVTNILFTEFGVLKISDFGFSRLQSDEKMTPNVVTRWYRAPELLFGATKYTTAIDVWSAGCIFAELLLKNPLFKADSDTSMIALMVETLGTPNDIVWPGFSELPLMKEFELSEQPYNRLTLKFADQPTSCIALLHKLFMYNPRRRISAHECLSHPYFTDKPTACDLPTLLTLLKKSEEI